MACDKLDAPPPGGVVKAAPGEGTPAANAPGEAGEGGVADGVSVTGTATGRDCSCEMNASTSVVLAVNLTSASAMWGGGYRPSDSASGETAGGVAGFGPLPRCHATNASALAAA